MIKTLLTFLITRIASINTSELRVISEAIFDNEKSAAAVPEDVAAAWFIVKNRYPQLKDVELTNLVKRSEAVAIIRQFVSGRGNILHFVVEGVLYLVRLIGGK